MRVSDLVGEGHECAVRVLLPVRGAAGRWHFWKDVVDSVEIDGEVYWEQICDRAPKLMDAPYGDLSDQTAAMLVDALAQGRDGECYFALWKGHGENSTMTSAPLDVPAWVPPLVRHLSLAPDSIGDLPGIPRDVILIHEPLSWLTRDLPVLGQQCPLMILPHDRSFVAACPIYHDSVYIGCTTILRDSLLAAELDSYPIELSSMIRGTIDWQPPDLVTWR
mgnify:FL=1